MRKSLIWITILITLSLVGIIVIQVSWIRNVLFVKQERADEQLSNAMEDVAQELMGEARELPPWASPLGITEWPKDQLLDLMQAPSVADRHSMLDIRRRLRRSFEKYGHPEVGFEFALISEANRMGYEMVSEGFEEVQIKARADSLHYRIAYLFLYEPSENLPPSGKETLIVVLAGLQRSVWRSIGWMIAGALIFTLIILSAFFVTVRAMLRQRKISQIRTDFINNMTHELKTPLTSLSVATDILQNERVLSQPEQLRHYAKIIKAENDRLTRHVETILQSAQYGKSDEQEELKPIHLHPVIEALKPHFGLRLQEAGGQLVLDLAATEDLVQGNATHLAIMFNNLVDNALKYSREQVPPEIRVTTQSKGRRLRIRVEDNGIGMTRETQSRIFEKFYRAHTGNLHNVKGFGLGLSHVRSILDAHHAWVKVESSLGKGSTFTLEFRLIKTPSLGRSSHH
ncbi:MAG: HAMP domain-containing histidine kinase [Bacteroidetes bacterium]|nr:HAMP domain-containing histidine kinase [Bacteroidota bacterium]